MLLASCLVLSSLAVAPQDSPFDFGVAWAAVAEALHVECESAGVVGGSVMFLRGNEVLGFEAHGFADRAGGVLVDRDTCFHWASCTKTLTGIAIMQLRDRKKLRLDQAIVDFVPELRRVRNAFGQMDEITITHLLSHSSGFRASTWPWGGDRDWHPHEPTKWSQLVAMLPYTEIHFEPGSKFSYSNPGIIFLGRTIEHLSGDGYEVYMDKNVLRPLGMSRSYFDRTPYHLQRYRSHSYLGLGATAKDRGADFDTGITVSNGGLNAPLTDMAKYLAFLLGAVPDDGDAAGVLARTSLEEMWRPTLPTARTQQERIGLTFFVQERDGSMFPTHTGGQHDFVSFFYVHPASKTAAIAAFNTSSSGPVMAKMRRMCMQTLSLAMQ